MAYWAVSRLALNHERLALHCLTLAGFMTYLPRLRERRISHVRRIERQSPLFPGYCFTWIELQWRAARWAPGTLGLIMDGTQPARVPDSVIAEIRSRECGGLIELPKPPRPRPGHAVRVISGPLQGRLGLYAGMKPRERVEVLLQLVGGQQRVTLARRDIEVIM